MAVTVTATSRPGQQNEQLELSPKMRYSLPAAAVFLLIGTFTAWFGIMDLFTASTAPFQLVGCLFLIAGIGMLAASASALHSESRAHFGRPTTILAGLSGVGVGSYLLYQQVTAFAEQLPPPSPLQLLRSSLWMGVILSAAGAGMVAFHAVPPSATAMRLGPQAKRLISAVGSIGLVFGGVQWWYTHQYLPGTTGAALSIKTDIAEVSSPIAATRVFQARVTIKNVSTTKVQVVSSLYKALWRDITTRPADTPTDESAVRSACFLEQLAPVQEPTCPHSFKDGLDRAYNISEYDRMSRNHPWGQDDWTASRYVFEGSNEVLELGKGVPDGTYFEANEEYAQVFLIHLPKEKEGVSDDDELIVQVELIVARGQNLVFTHPDFHGPEQVSQSIQSRAEHEDNQAGIDLGKIPRPYPARYEVTESKIAPLSRIHQLIHGPQSIYIIRVLSERQYEAPLPEYPYVTSCINSSERFVGTTSASRIRRDPTEVCPGTWTPPFRTAYGGAEKL